MEFIGMLKFFVGKFNIFTFDRFQPYICLKLFFFFFRLMQNVPEGKNGNIL